jgi:micrococcal nuclease
MVFCSTNKVDNKINNLKQLLLTLTIILISPTILKAWEGKVVGISDGDTISVLNSGVGKKVRLYGIDSPEKSQAFGNKAKRFTADLVFGQYVDVTTLGKDRNDRIIGLVYLKKNGQCLNKELVKNGLAWVFTKYCLNEVCKNWSKFENEARNNKIGLWADVNPIPPWEFRHGNKYDSQNQTSIKDHKDTAYHGNVSSKVFHCTGCKYYNCKNCTKVFYNRKDAINSGFRPCKICNP